jgi:hypothetical protein
MTKVFLIHILLLFALAGNAQSYDAQWALGYGESLIDFRKSDTVTVDSEPFLQGFFLTNACICDENGNFLYYTNGVNICNLNDTLVGGGLCDCDESDSIDGLALPQAAIFIPQPGNNRYYYLFHCWNDALQQTRPSILYYSLIDKEANGGLGEVIQKNVPIISGQILRGGGMTACKHANGRDYWLVIGASNSNGFYKFLITPDSIIGPITQYIGIDFPVDFDITYSKFSQDGSRYATGAVAGLILLMDFDRCTGEFSNPITISNNDAIATDTTQLLPGCASLEFSPNGRYLYVSGVYYLNQYDLEASNIQDSVRIYEADSNDYFQLGFLQLGPNGKLYGSTWNGGLEALHVVNYPDLPGDNADFMYGGQPDYTLNSINLPNLINYQLGPLVGSTCAILTPDTIKDTTGVGILHIEDADILRVLPNPADKYLYVEMGMPATEQSGKQGIYEFELFNESGQLIATKETRQVDIFDTEGLAAGVYFIKVLDKNNSTQVITKQVVVQH